MDLEGCGADSPGEEEEGFGLRLFIVHNVARNRRLTLRALELRPCEEDTDNGEGKTRMAMRAISKEYLHCRAWPKLVPLPSSTIIFLCTRWIGL